MRDGWRGALERHLRRAWRGRPGPGLRAAAMAFGAVADLRHLAYECGIARREQAPVPVISVGGLTVGGGGKTPLAAEVGRWLSAAGRDVAIITAGESDEILVHRELNSAAHVEGGRDRLGRIRRAAAAGAEIAVLDSGFQHLRLKRDLELVTIDVDRFTRTRPRRLPAGPYRERAARLAAGDVAVLLRREAPAAVAHRLGTMLRERYPRLRIARGVLVRVGAEAANRRAHLHGGPCGAVVAVAGVMYPEPALRAMRAACPRIQIAKAFPDHVAYSPRLVQRLVDVAGDDGLIGTLKDVVKLRPAIDERVPLWYLAEMLRWEGGERRLRRAVTAIAAAPAAGGEVS